MYHFRYKYITETRIYENRRKGRKSKLHVGVLPGKSFRFRRWDLSRKLCTEKKYLKTDLRNIKFTSANKLCVSRVSFQVPPPQRTLQHFVKSSRRFRTRYCDCSRWIPRRGFRISRLRFPGIRRARSSRNTKIALAYITMMKRHVSERGSIVEPSRPGRHGIERDPRVFDLQTQQTQHVFRRGLIKWFHSRTHVSPIPSRTSLGNTQRTHTHTHRGRRSFSRAQETTPAAERGARPSHRIAIAIHVDRYTIAGLRYVSATIFRRRYTTVERLILYNAEVAALWATALFFPFSLLSQSYLGVMHGWKGLCWIN